MHVTLTRRGWAVLAIICLSIAMGWQYGPRSLNAIVAPLLVILLAGFVVTLRLDRPAVRRLPMEDGFVGETREAAFAVETTGDVAATVRDEIGTGLAFETDEARTHAAGSVSTTTHTPATETILDGETRVTYDVALASRGDRTVGPATITIRDVFGLVTRRFEFGETSSVTVYPQVYELQGALDERLHEFADATARRNREEFDHLREYRRGDSLRDVHWKAAAKQPEDDLVVTEYAADAGLETVTIAAESATGLEDELATAVASIVTALRETSIRVGLVVDGTVVHPSSDAGHYYELLAVLAALESGAGTAALTDRDRADAEIRVTARTRAVSVVIGEGETGHEIPFERLRGTSERARPGPAANGGGRRDAGQRATGTGDGGGETETETQRSGVLT
ncbi:DUF58 domain-containing protein [Natrialba asiatica]|uniref:DUF58 domain-containing protein n=1 Tax=Natrialba asiatica (strain ATCC 700177 / DSM 12278 / JCM 9576 / FERM P-10747 / NBRC 102637 / 172P1) TaxID=29540 RepID=M0B222_NATA1|nr:DUF58 domain-containing protein [Natrialba asiatica]ELZ04835.1 hypothetical protein C481_03612 [Natrialba asiatica DSM 12278]